MIDFSTVTLLNVVRDKVLEIDKTFSRIKNRIFFYYFPISHHFQVFLEGNFSLIIFNWDQ